jgi:drug/metabolite transporter (DMT)-like permease
MDLKLLFLPIICGLMFSWPMVMGKSKVPDPQTGLVLVVANLLFIGVIAVYRDPNVVGHLVATPSGAMRLVLIAVAMDCIGKSALMRFLSIETPYMWVLITTMVSIQVISPQLMEAAFWTRKMPHPMVLAGMAVIIAGVVLVQWGAKQQHDQEVKTTVAHEVALSRLDVSDQVIH